MPRVKKKKKKRSASVICGLRYPDRVTYFRVSFFPRVVSGYLEHHWQQLLFLQNQVSRPCLFFESLSLIYLSICREIVWYNFISHWLLQHGWTKVLPKRVEPHRFVHEEGLPAGQQPVRHRQGGGRPRLLVYEDRWKVCNHSSVILFWLAFVSVTTD